MTLLLHAATARADPNPNPNPNEQIFDATVPEIFFAPLHSAPLDLLSPCFYRTRQPAIDKRLASVAAAPPTHLAEMAREDPTLTLTLALAPTLALTPTPTLALTLTPTLALALTLTRCERRTGSTTARRVASCAGTHRGATHTWSTYSRSP